MTKKIEIWQCDLTVCALTWWCCIVFLAISVPVEPGFFIAVGRRRYSVYCFDLTKIGFIRFCCRHNIPFPDKVLCFSVSSDSFLTIWFAMLWAGYWSCYTIRWWYLYPLAWMKTYIIFIAFNICIKTGWWRCFVIPYSICTMYLHFAACCTFSIRYLEHCWAIY